MDKGANQYWTPGKEVEFEELIKHCRSFAERHLIMVVRDALKYDGRTKEGKKARVQARLRLAVASDEDLKELAEMEVEREERERPEEIPGLLRASLVAEELGHLKNTRAEIREKGINKEKL